MCCRRRICLRQGAAWQQPMNFVTLPDLSRSAAQKHVASRNDPPALSSRVVPEEGMFRPRDSAGPGVLIP